MPLFLLDDLLRKSMTRRNVIQSDLIKFIHSVKATKFCEISTLLLTADWHYIGQKEGGDFAKFCGLLKMYDLYFFLVS